MMIANRAELERVLHGMEHCATDPESREDCGDCPYGEQYEVTCIANLCTEAKRVIEALLQQIDGDGGAAS